MSVTVVTETRSFKWQFRYGSKQGGGGCYYKCPFCGCEDIISRRSGNRTRKCYACVAVCRIEYPGTSTVGEGVAVSTWKLTIPMVRLLLKAGSEFRDCRDMRTANALEARRLGVVWNGMDFRLTELGCRVQQLLRGAVDV